MQSEFACAGDRGVTVLDAALTVDRTLVSLDRIEGHDQAPADLTSRQPGGEQTEDRHLLGGQLLIRYGYLMVLHIVGQQISAVVGVRRYSHR
jgi:hypothetical protein